MKSFLIVMALASAAAADASLPAAGLPAAAAFRAVEATCGGTRWIAERPRRTAREEAAKRALLDEADRLLDGGKALASLDGAPDERRAAVALALVRKGDAELERLLAPMPRVNLAARPRKNLEREVRRLQSWFEAWTAGVERATRYYQDAAAAGDPPRRLLAMTRYGELQLAFAGALAGGPMPEIGKAPPNMTQQQFDKLLRDAYCDQLGAAITPLLAKAREAFSRCVAEARERGVAPGLAQPCRDGLARLGGG